MKYCRVCGDTSSTAVLVASFTRGIYRKTKNP